MNGSVNFSPNPFKRPSKSLYGLWLINPLLLVLAAALLFHWNQLKHRNTLTHAEIDSIEDQGRELDRNQARALKELAEINLVEYRKKVSQFQSIQAGFDTHWGGLLDDLGEQLPANVRILAIKPRQSRRRQSDGAQKIVLEAEARAKQSQLEFIRALQEHPAFRAVQFEAERYEKADGGLITFEISFSYRKQGGRS
ncbi:hypothetical protein [Acanthopleuribacter pedis]|uniref:Uncharacterized protein n=1 Tax=Acanthopleuribacter pedis TaxID=442870 RepID=A0A8J7QGB8_9BACT|nr:hypothetical protein [Acanthopleuribacter pedis]MBO1318113.1 hypothetical protein [Acanthopleuribacter pedis]